MECAVDKLKSIRIEDYTYSLPDERIAKFPLAHRDDSKLLYYNSGNIVEYPFRSAPDLLPANTTLIFNNTKVIHARIFFKKDTGANIEIFCLEPHAPIDYASNFAAQFTCDWSCMVGNLKKWKEEPITTSFSFENKAYTLTAQKLEQSNGEVIVRFSWDVACSFSEVLESCGKMPIPPYLNREAEASDDIRYQTIFSKEEGSVAAPTAALHFSEEVVANMKAKGVKISEVTLHVGAGTFRPVKSVEIGDHNMHTEHIDISRELIETLIHRKGDVIAVGTTSVRSLESLYWMGVKCKERMDVFNHISQWESYTLPSHYTLDESMHALLEWMDNEHVDRLSASTTIIIVPGYTFRVIDGMFTNFHQPQSTLLLLVAAAVGEDWRRIYQFALENGYRFLSYGDSSYLRINK